LAESSAVPPIRLNGKEGAGVRSQAVRGIGVDILELTRFSEFLERNDTHLSDVFTPHELSAAVADGRRTLYLATRWALKEAVLKAIGTGWGQHVDWTDVEAVGDAFAPRILLHGAAEAAAAQGGTAQALGSAAATGDTVVATAVVISCAQPGNRES